MICFLHFYLLVKVHCSQQFFFFFISYYLVIHTNGHTNALRNYLSTLKHKNMCMSVYLSLFMPCAPNDMTNMEETENSEWGSNLYDTNG